MQVMQVQFLSQEDPLEEHMATHTSTLACRVPQTDEPGGCVHRQMSLGGYVHRQRVLGAVSTDRGAWGLWSTGLKRIEQD